MNKQKIINGLKNTFMGAALVGSSIAGGIAGYEVAEPYYNTGASSAEAIQSLEKGLVEASVVQAQFSAISADVKKAYQQADMARAEELDAQQKELRQVLDGQYKNIEYDLFLRTDLSEQDFKSFAQQYQDLSGNRLSPNSAKYRDEALEWVMTTAPIESREQFLMDVKSAVSDGGLGAFMASFMGGMSGLMLLLLPLAFWDIHQNQKKHPKRAPGPEN